MNNQWWCTACIGAAVVALFFLAMPEAWAQQAQEDPRSRAEARQFDFWIGHWDLTWPGGKGSNRISFALDSVVILEEFSGQESIALRGMSLSVYDMRAGAWKQTWVDNQGGYLDFVGGFNGQSMILQRSAVLDGQHALQRMIWFNITRDSLDWAWERSDDSGSTWKTLWPIHYVRKP